VILMEVINYLVMMIQIIYDYSPFMGIDNAPMIY
jgi:hypothetical protein